MLGTMRCGVAMTTESMPLRKKLVSIDGWRAHRQATAGVDAATIAAATTRGTRAPTALRLRAIPAEGVANSCGTGGERRQVGGATENTTACGVILVAGVVAGVGLAHAKAGDHGDTRTHAWADACRLRLPCSRRARPPTL